MAWPITKMSDEQQQDWRSRFCGKQASWLWGEMREVSPELLPLCFGDGKQALGYIPIITRLHHYIVAIDSSIDINAPDKPIHAMSDDIRDAIDEYFGSCGCSDCVGLDDGEEYDQDAESEDHSGQWPVACWSIGSEWWVITDDVTAALRGDLVKNMGRKSLWEYKQEPQ